MPDKIRKTNKKTNKKTASLHASDKSDNTKEKPVRKNKTLRTKKTARKASPKKGSTRVARY